MHTHLPAADLSQSGHLSRIRSAPRRGALLLLTVAMAALLSACGGGGDGGGQVSLGVNAVVGGQPLTDVYSPGVVGTIDLAAGQSIELDANESVDWTFTAGGNVLFGSGTTVFVDGLAVTETAVSPSRVVIDTSITGPYVSPVTITLEATSTIDAAQVATINLVVH